MKAAKDCSVHAYVTISVDDGHPTDLRTAELLQKYGLRATFYVPATNVEREVMSRDNLRHISRAFELGGHTLSHVSLQALPQERAWAEIVDSKHWLEDLTGNRIVSFCYPKGKFDSVTAELVKKAGFWGARTCLFNLHDFPANPFLWGVTTQAYSHGRTVQMRHALLENNFAGAWNYWMIYRGIRFWHHHFLRALDHVAECGGIAHLYIHSWEIDQFDQWRILESIFRSISTNDSFVRVNNGELFALWKKERSGAKPRPVEQVAI